MKNVKKEKDMKYKNLDKTYTSIIHIIEKQKKNIKNLQDKLSQKQRDENSKIKIIQEKEQEIGILKGFINSLKNENSMLNNSINNERRKNQNLKTNSNMPSRINSGMSNNRNNNNYGNQYRPKQNLPSIKSNFSKNNIKNVKNINNNVDNINNNNNLEKNFSNESLPFINNGNSNNNSFINRGNNLSNQLQDIEAYDEENFKNIDTLMKKIMSI